MADNSLDEDEKKKYRMKQREWRYLAKRYSYNIKGEELFETLDARSGNNDVLDCKDIIENIKSSEIGLELLKFLSEKDIPIYLSYGIELDDENEVGRFFEDAIYVYVDRTKTVNETALTIIHEATHAKIDKPNTKNQEFECFANEYRHRGIKLTESVKKFIIRHIDEMYDDLEWE